MSLLPPSTLTSSGQIIETPAGTALQGGPGQFSKIRDGSSSQNAQAQLVSQVSPPPATTPVPDLASRARADILKPNLEYAGNSLSVLNARIGAIEPASAPASLQNRLELLNSQFRLIGNNLQETAAKNDPIELLRLQNDIYQLDEELELVSKVVDQATNGIRSLLQTQV